jgi:hypothetical protein
VSALGKPRTIATSAIDGGRADHPAQGANNGRDPAVAAIRRESRKRQAAAETKENSKMRGTRSFAALAIVTALAVLGASTTAWSYFDGRTFRGGYVKPCSLDGVNPVYHRDIFGNPALARAVYGFVQARDGSWHVAPGCRQY